MRGTANLLTQPNSNIYVGEMKMKVEENKPNKKRSNFFLTDDARGIIGAKVRELGVSKSGVVELALRDLAAKAVGSKKERLLQ